MHPDTLKDILTHPELTPSLTPYSIGYLPISPCSNTHFLSQYFPKCAEWGYFYPKFLATQRVWPTLRTSTP